VQILICFACTRHLTDYVTIYYLIKITIKFTSCVYARLPDCRFHSLNSPLIFFSAAKYDREVLDVMCVSRVSVDMAGGVGVVSTDQVAKSSSTMKETMLSVLENRSYIFCHLKNFIQYHVMVTLGTHIFPPILGLNT
jgi:hypothetical protein